MVRPARDDVSGVDAVMAGARAFVAVIVESSAQHDAAVTPQQLRMLNLIQAHPGANLASLAAWMDVHPSSATRVCDRLVRAALVSRVVDPEDRRNVRLSLTRGGRRYLDAVMASRRSALERVTGRMSARDRVGLARSLAAFAQAAGEVHGDGLWPLPPADPPPGEHGGHR